MTALATAETQNEDITRAFVAYSLEQMPSFVRAWRGQRLAEDIGEATASVVGLLDDDEAARSYADTMSVIGLAPEHFRAKLIDAGGHRFLAQIDFPNTAGDEPFISIFRGSRLPGSFDTRAVMDAIADRFAIFAPVAAQFFHPSHVPMSLPGARIDQHFIAGHVQDMIEHPKAAGFSRVVLSAARDLDFYPRYVDSYEQMFSVRPELRDDVSIETQESLAECLEQKLLFEIAVDGAWAGVVAARHQMLAGIDAIFMVEIVLDQRARGQGLGPAVHQHLAREVALLDPDAIISGTIAPANIPSLKTALRTGRRHVGAWYRFDF